MAIYQLHTYVDRHEGQKTGTVRSWTPGAVIEAPEGEFKDLAVHREYNRIDDDAPTDPNGDSTTASDTETDTSA